MFQPRTVPEIPFWHSCLQVKTYQPDLFMNERSEVGKNSENTGWRGPERALTVLDAAAGRRDSCLYSESDGYIFRIGRHIIPNWMMLHS